MGKSRKKHKRRSSSASLSSESESDDDSPPRRSKGSRHAESQSRSWQKRSKHSRNSRSRSPGRKKSDKHSKKKPKKESRRRRSPSSDSESSEEDNRNMDILKRVEEERQRAIQRKQREIEEMRKQKNLMKETETPEEKRVRRLRKKELKERKRKERMGWDNEYLHYTNTDNPFGDGNLLDTFTWKKKLDKEGLANIEKDDLERINRLKQEENRMELEKVKKRRLERESEKKMREEETQILQRQKEAAQFKEWERQEDNFHLDQARLRSKIRIEDGRAKPIDLLAKYISAEEDVDAVEMHEPYTYLTGLSARDLEDLLEDIKVYKELERGYNLDFWNDMTIIVEEELNQIRKSDSDMCMGERREGIHTSVADDVSNVFRKKSYQQLSQLYQQISKRLNERHEGTDVSYWESLLQQLNAHMARARLRKRHKDNLQKKLELLKAESGMVEEERKAQEIKQETVKEEIKEETNEEEEPIPETSTGRRVKEEDKDTDEQSSDEEEEKKEKDKDDDDDEEDEDEKGKEREEEDILQVSIRDYDSGRYTPPLVQMEELELGTIVIPEEDDEKQLQLARLHVLGTGRKVENVLTAEEKALQQEAKRGMNDDEAQFSVEAPLKEHSYLWSDKYRPRKPRYFNRVHTGFEWNKYNQTHYDMDNPPPKIVQGYKFNIFYPDLIDRSTTPEYHLTPLEDNKDFAILRFHAGPPYEDIAFKIVNREWEYSYKRGFRCQFHNNIFQLWFHFKRYRYRR